MLGLQTVKVMDLIAVNPESFSANVVKCDLFHVDLGYALLTIDPTVTPSILPCHKIPISLALSSQKQIK